MSSMSSTYPAAVDTFDANTDWSGDPNAAPATARITASDVNNVQDAIAATQTALGVNPQGAYATVAARLAALLGLTPASVGAPSTATTGTLTVGQVAQVDATSAPCTRTLPAASTAGAGACVAVKKIDASGNAVTVTRNGSDTITSTVAGAPTRALTLAGEAVELVSDGVSAWIIRASNTPSPVLLALFAPLASPTFTGDPKAPTPSAGDNDTSIATTAFVQSTATTVAAANAAALGIVFGA